MTCVGVTVPAAVKLTPHAPAMQVRVPQNVSLPGHVVGRRHCTQTPAPLHSVLPFTLHAVPAAVLGFEGVPRMHLSLVHSLPSTGTSVLSTTDTAVPLPSHSSE